MRLTATLIALAGLLSGCNMGSTPATDQASANAGSTPARPSPYAGRTAAIGRAATANEVAAWDIDVRPDFKGLPPGSGSVDDGEQIWQTTCASCHGDFGDSNKVFSPLVLGNITEDDIKTGHVAALKDPSRVRTTFMKVSTISTVWDYIHRAMPWNNPKSLSDDQVYAVLAYLLNLAYIVPSDFVLSDKNIAGVQARMPNRNGMTRDHGLWKIDGKPDTHAVPCMTDCTAEVKITSSIPDFARNANGDLSKQTREYGPFVGIKTAAADAAETNPAQADAESTAQSTTDTKPAADTKATALIKSNGCTGCHQIEGKLVGPGFAAVAQKYAQREDATAYLKKKIRDGGSGAWGSVPMPAQPSLSDADLDAIAQWLAHGATH